jgi:hypothetical protein
MEAASPQGCPPVPHQPGVFHLAKDKDFLPFVVFLFGEDLGALVVAAVIDAGVFGSLDGAEQFGAPVVAARP